MNRSFGISRALLTFSGLALGVWLLAGSAPLAAAQTVRGQLAVSGLGPRTRAVLTSHWEEWNGAVARREARLAISKQLTVVLTGDAPATPLTYRIRGGALEADTVVVRTGSNFTVENTDIFDHELSADGLATFAKLATAPGQGRTIAAAASGKWIIKDEANPSFAGHLVAVNQVVARATLDDTGRFVVSEVPPGNYTLAVFYAGEEVASQPLTVGAVREVTVAPIAVKVTPKSR